MVDSGGEGEGVNDYGTVGGGGDFDFETDSGVETGEGRVLGFYDLLREIGMSLTFRRNYFSISY